MFKCDKNQMLYCNVQSFKKWNFRKFWAIDRHGPHWINFTIFTFISEKIYNFKAHIKFGKKLFHLTWEKIGESKIGHRFYEKNGEIGGPRSESLCFKKGTPTMLGPNLGGNVMTYYIQDFTNCHITFQLTIILTFKKS
jgi:hypothetical protein